MGDMSSQHGVSAKNHEKTQTKYLRACQVNIMSVPKTNEKAQTKYLRAMSSQHEGTAKKKKKKT